jgi:hypothetical protein
MNWVSLLINLEKQNSEDADISVIGMMKQSGGILSNTPQLHVVNRVEGSTPDKKGGCKC